MRLVLSVWLCLVTHATCAAAATTAVVPNRGYTCTAALDTLSGAWYDDATQDTMQVSVATGGCVLTSKYGATAVVGARVLPETGILRTLDLEGRYIAGLERIEWSNGMQWQKLPSGGAGAAAHNDTRLAALEKVVHTLHAANAAVNATVVVLEKRVTSLLARNAALAANQTTLVEQIRSVALCSACPLKGGFAPTPAPPTAAPVGAPKTTKAPSTAAPLTPAPPTRAPLTPSPPTGAPPTPAPPTGAPPTGSPPDLPPTGPAVTLETLQAQVAQLNATLRAVNATAGKDGYCTILPKAAQVYIPVTRYTVRRGSPANMCYIPGTAGGALNVTLPDGCVWGGYMADRIYAQTGDSLAFKREGPWHDVREFANKAAYDSCDMAASKLVAGKPDLAAADMAGKHFSIALGAAGTRWFGSGTDWGTGVDAKTHCWPGHSKQYPGKAKKWGDGVRIEVVVMDPKKEVMAECPLWDPSKYNVSGGAAVDSKSVERLKGTVGAIGRQLISVEARIEERVRAEGNSGITVARSFQQGTDSYHEASYAEQAPAGLHNHANFKYTLGMGECGAVLNGVQFQTRHNDFSLDEPDYTKSAAEYISTWPPASRLIDLPAVPPSVTSKATVAEQVAEMKAYFKAFHTQDKTLRADYDKYFKANLCYLEGTWQEAQDGIAEPFASDRHHIAADDWKDLMQKLNFLANNGQKSILENLPFLPTSFRGMKDTGAGGDVFEPRMGQWFYRIKCRPINKAVPLSRFRVKNDLQLQFRDVPLTREQLGKTNRALFELHPTPDAKYNPKEAWPKSATTFEYIDELMQDIPGFDGPKGNLVDKSMGHMCLNANGSNTDLNTAYYSRYYAHKTQDAMGRDKKKRGFNDLMFAAQTTHPKVSALEACTEFADEMLKVVSAEDKASMATCVAIKEEGACRKKVWTKAQVSADASGARCAWADGSCEFKKCWKQGWSYAIPLEIVFTTPLTEWNPYNIPMHKDGTPAAANVRANGADGSSADKALKGSTKRDYFRTPAEFFQNPKDVDPADTSGGATFVQNSAGEVHRTRASGHWILFPEIPGVGSVRQRYPIMPVHDEGSSVWKEAKALEEVVMGRHSKEVDAIIKETRTQEYGMLLTLLAGSGHTHTVLVPAEDVHAMVTGQYSEVKVLSSTDTGHTHLTLISYDAKKGPGKEYSLLWCTTGSALPSDECPVQAGCGKSTEGKDCCAKRCPDGHGGVSQL